MLWLSDYYARLKPLLPARAFLRTDRKDALFVSDAPRFVPPCEIDLPGYELRFEGTLVRITPKYESVPTEMRELFTQVLKSDNESAQKLLRQNLALKLRLGDRENAAYLENLLKEVQLHEA